MRTSCYDLMDKETKDFIPLLSLIAQSVWLILMISAALYVEFCIHTPKPWSYELQMSV